MKNIILYISQYQVISTVTTNDPSMDVKLSHYSMSKKTNTRLIDILFPIIKELYKATYLTSHAYTTHNPI